MSPRILASCNPLTKPSLPSVTTTDPSSSSSSSSPSGKSSSVTAGTCQVSEGKKGGNERCKAVLLYEQDIKGVKPLIAHPQTPSQASAQSSFPHWYPPF